MLDQEKKRTRFEWALPRRARSQDLLLRLYAFLEENPQLDHQHARRAVFGLLVGAAFSLWRAAFLAPPERDWASSGGILEGARELLERLLHSNALLYRDEERIEGWSVGYYLNNAYYRIASAIERLPPEDVPALSEFLEQKRRGITSDSPQVIWDRGCDAAYAALDLLERQPQSAVGET